ncbi:MAG TPA: conjugative transposon protein TraN [Ginsengibacter sp.]|nr:conjugative transposon protein TraN [Ginsengibacter sp.]HRP43559.1 conjugative transposon protein TraN [Ginsengibacter sp.]
MRKIFINLFVITCLVFLSTSIQAQQTASNTDKSVMAKIDAYELPVTFNKTTHLIFPAAIRYVDLGSEYVIAGKAEDAENVLRIKASVKDFDCETNFSVITDDGRFYNFNVRYSAHPAVLNYNLLTMTESSESKNGNDILFEELGNNPPYLVGMLLKTIYEENKRNIRHIRSKSNGIQFLLKGIYIHNGKFYFHTELHNKSNVLFNIDFINFKIVDKKVAKRTAVQEKTITPLRIYKPLTEIAGNASGRNVLLFDQFTMTDDKILIVEIFEKNGGRQQVLQVKNSDLMEANLINEIHLKIN